MHNTMQARQSQEHWSNTLTEVTLLDVFCKDMNGHGWHGCRKSSGVAGGPVEWWEQENGVRRAGVECIRDHAWEIGEIAVAAVNGSAPQPLFVA